MGKEHRTVSMDSTIGALYDTPVGHDILAKLLLQLNVSEGVLKNPVLSHVKLRTLQRIAKGKIGEELLPAILKLVNSEKDLPAEGSGLIRPAWWKEAVFYQIYPRSFCDANGDGIGDLKGILEKLDYLKSLGVNALWLSPIYDSPNDDNGYDIRDYRKIMAEFGTMEDFDALLEGVHSRGMRLIMDLVVNHTSDEHAWFQKALEEEHAPERGYYYFVRDPEGKTPPNNWVSFFSGSAWKYYPEQQVWALHLFSAKQMDLNWDEPAVREQVADMVNWWLDKGVDGFRMDVINYISKARSADGSLPQGNKVIGDLMAFTGIENYYYGPHLHDYLRELHTKAFAPHKAFSVGEVPGLGMQMCQLVTGEERGELDMVFSFDQLETPGHVRFDDYRYDLNYYRDYITDWMLHYGNQCRMSLFYNNHDNPRMASKVTTDPQMREAVQTLLAAMQMTLKGTPFLFQGDEMGLVNYRFTSMDQITDVESRNLYTELLEKGKTKEEAFAVILAGTREQCRVLLPWNGDGAAGAGRTLGRRDALPEGVDPDKIPTFLPQQIHPEITEVYRQLIALRREHKALIYGDFELLNGKKDRFVYHRWDETDSFVIECNLGEKEKKAVFAGRLTGKAEGSEDGKYEQIFRTEKYRDLPAEVLGPYEVRIWKKTPY